MTWWVIQVCAKGSHIQVDRHAGREIALGIVRRIRPSPESTFHWKLRLTPEGLLPFKFYSLIAKAKEGRDEAQH
jgi:hypothetical protein